MIRPSTCPLSVVLPRRLASATKSIAHSRALAVDVFGTVPSYKVLGKWTLTAAGIVSRQVRELRELLPRYEHDNLFDSTKFKRRFSDFEVTTYRRGLELIRREPVHNAA